MPAKAVEANGKVSQSQDEVQPQKLNFVYVGFLLPEMQGSTTSPNFQTLTSMPGFQRSNFMILDSGTHLQTQASAVRLYIPCNMLRALLT